MSLPTYDWYALAASDTREMARRERMDITGSTALDVSIVIALFAILVLFTMIYVL